MSVLPGEKELHRLQRYRSVAKVIDQPRQDIFPQAQRKLRELSAESQSGYQASPFHGVAAVYGLIVAAPPEDAVGDVKFYGKNHWTRGEAGEKI